MFTSFFYTDKYNVTITGNFGNPAVLSFLYMHDNMQAARTYTTTEDPTGRSSLFQNIYI